MPLFPKLKPLAVALYNLFTRLYFTGLRIAAFFHPKARLFVQGRKGLFQKIEKALRDEKRKIIWMHCASLGEFEQGRPLLNALKANMPEYALVLTFFSPSGYETRKESPDADYVFYLPTESAAHARRFLALLRPAMALFVKYEFWYHYLKTLHRQQVPVVLFSAFFQANQPFFKWYGGFYRRMLSFYRQIFVQDAASRSLLAGIGIEHVQIAGDTRIDRSLSVRSTCKPIPDIATFKGSGRLLIAGSTWQKDIDFLKEVLEGLEEWKVVIAPHEADVATVRYIRQAFQGAVLWNRAQVVGWPPVGAAQSGPVKPMGSSSGERVDSASGESMDSSSGEKIQPLSQGAEASKAIERVLILNTVGILNQAYQYADAVWIGGGFSRGIHNIIEPAVFGVPVFFGPNHHRFREADALIRAGGGRSLHTAERFRQALHDPEALGLMGRSASAYVRAESGATRKIMDYLFKWRSTSQ